LRIAHREEKKNNLDQDTAKRIVYKSVFGKETRRPPGRRSYYGGSFEEKLKREKTIPYQRQVTGRFCGFSSVVGGTKRPGVGTKKIWRKVLSKEDKQRGKRKISQWCGRVFQNREKGSWVTKKREKKNHLSPCGLKFSFQTKRQLGVVLKLRAKKTKHQRRTTPLLIGPP